MPPGVKVGNTSPVLILTFKSKFYLEFATEYQETSTVHRYVHGNF